MAKFCCRLCLQEASPLLEVFSEIGEELHINEIVAQHFWFQIKQNDSISNKVCTVCWNKVENFHDFYLQVQRAEEAITVIVDSKIELKKIVAEAENNDEEDVEEMLSEYKDEIHFGEHFDDEEETEVETKMIIEVDEDDINLLEETEQHVAISSAEQEIESLLEINMQTQRPARVKTGKRMRKTREARNDENEEEDSSASEEYSRKKKRGRRAVKKELLEAEVEKEKHNIEEYYRMQCNICLDECEKFDILFEHYTDVHNVRGFILCCGKKFYRRTVIAEHIEWHKNPDIFKCVVCNKVYADKRCLNNHMLAHAPPEMKLYKCDHCEKSFVKKCKLDQHKLSHLTAEEKKYICSDCEKPYASEALLRAHKRVVHEKTYAHMCEICAKVFKSRVFFEKHQLEHLGRKLPRVQCTVCEAWMKNEHTMRAHMRLHQDEGMIHECDICGKQGPSRNAILKHKRFVHLSERKFKCTLCDKAFKRAITLKEHMTTHTGEVLYSCTFCSKTFNSGANMHAHRKKAHRILWEQEKQKKLNLLKDETSP